MENIILASTSAVYGGNYLEYISAALAELFRGIPDILFIPYARPSGISYDDYTTRAAGFFSQLGIRVRGIHEFEDPVKALEDAPAYFTGGGNTFLLVKTLYDEALMDPLKQEVRKGKPYLGCSAGSNIGGLTMQTTNDMPIVYPPSFATLGLVPFNINPHYLDPVPGLKHNGETRETRILEFLSQNSIPVVGLREGSWIRVQGNDILLQGNRTARIFEKGKEPYELETGSLIPF